MIVNSVGDLSKIMKQALGSTAPCGQDSPGAFIWAIGQVVDPNVDLYKTLRTQSDVLEHRSFTFAFVCMQDVLVEIVTRSRLHYTTTETTRRGVYLVIASGTLKEWRDSIILDWQSFDSRKIMNECLSYFDSVDLGQVFGSYKRLPHKDGTLLLEKK